MPLPPFPAVDPLDLTQQQVPEQCAGCARLEDPEATTVVLLAGQTVCTWCPAWREETRLRQIEAIHVLGLADKPARLAHLDAREAAYGAEYRRRLEAVILSTHHERRAAKAAADADA